MKLSSSNISAWRTRLAPLFVEAVPELQGTMAETIGEALALPPVDVAVGHSLPLDITASQREETVAWIRRILRPAWIDDQALCEWLGNRTAILGLDALFGGWETPAGAIQIISTKRRLHFRTRLPTSKPLLDGRSRITGAASLAGGLFEGDIDWTTLTWDIQPFGALTVGYQELPFVANWRDSCLIVTDGTAVKFSFLKIIQRQSPAHGGSGLRDLSPWFAKPSVDS